MGDVLVQHSPNIQLTTPRRQWHQGTHNSPKKAIGLTETLTAVFSPSTWPRDPATRKENAFPAKLPLHQPATFTKQIDQPCKPFEIPSTPQRQDQAKETPRNSPSKSPPSSCTPLIRSSSNLTVSDRIKKCQDGSKNLNKTLETPLSQKMEMDTPSPLQLGMRMDMSGESADRFWLGRTSKISEPTTPTPLGRRQPNFRGNYRFAISNDNMETKVTSALDHAISSTDADDDSASTCSYSVLSDDTIEYPPAPRLTRFTRDEEIVFFNHIYDILDASFSEWEERVNYRSGEPLSLEKVEDATLSLPHIRDDYVIFGRRPDRQGYWEGRLELTGQYTEIKKLRCHSFENGISFGVEIGSIQDFESMGGAMLFMAVDRKMYYTDQDGFFHQDEFGRYCYKVIGPYDFRSIRKDKILDPFPPEPYIVWGNEMMEEEKNT